MTQGSSLRSKSCICCFSLGTLLLFHHRDMLFYYATTTLVNLSSLKRKLIKKIGKPLKLCLQKASKVSSRGLIIAHFKKWSPIESKRESYTSKTNFESSKSSGRVVRRDIHGCYNINCVVFLYRLLLVQEFPAFLSVSSQASPFWITIGDLEPRERFLR